LSLYNIIKLADEIGWTDEQLATVFIIYLKTYKSAVYYEVSPKKANIRQMFDQCLLYCQSNEEIANVRSELEKFCRKPGTAFSEAISQFDSLNTHLAQLLKPVPQDELA
jgi:hypothetical protein